MALAFNINTDAAVVLTNKLEQLHRSALPTAIRQTLNSAAFDVKTRTMPESVEAEFVNRDKNFFRVKSRVKLAKGWDIKTMKSIIGFIDADKNKAVADLEQQERGGTIQSKSFISMNQARQGSNNKRKIQKANRLSNINRIRNIDKLSERTGNKKLFHWVVAKSGVGGHILYKNTLFKVKAIERGKIKLIPLYSYQKNRTVKAKATNFMKEASIKSANKMENFYIVEAQKQIKRLIK